MRPETMDRLSDLPKHILHDILSRMSLKDGARTSILSKAWNHTWSTFPILYFYQDIYVQLNKPRNIEDLERKKNNFVNHVEKTLTRFHDQGLAIREFNLCMEYSDSQSIYPRLDYWMRLAKESGVQVIKLRLFHGRDHGNDKCCLPPCILEAKSLTTMRLWSLKIGDAFMNNPIQFSSLQVLQLYNVTLGDEQIIQNIICSCPLIEYLALCRCFTMKPHQHGLKSVRVQGLHKLKSVVAICIQGIDIDAPSLEDFQYEPARINIPFKINVDKCRNLRELDLSFLETIIIADQWLLELFCKFPLLERLKLHSCSFSKRVKISCVSLKVLEMSACLDLEEVIIDAPNLFSLRYHSNVQMPILTFLQSSSLLQFDAFLHSANPQDFRQLREVLQTFEHRDILATLSLQFNYIYEFNLDELRDISVPLPSIKHLNVKIPSPYTEISVLHLVTGLLWSCCPATISIPLEHKICYSVVKVLKEVLIDRKLDECCCSSSDIKCWWHSLKDVKVTRKVENIGSKVYPFRLRYVTFELEY